jgi:hypothetical protein
MSLPFHSVHIYRESHHLITQLRRICSSSLAIGDPVIVIATEEHHHQLTAALLQDGVDVPKHARKGIYNAFNAEDLLPTLMVKDRVEPNLFRASFLALLAAVREHAQGEVTLFGEMVALLWEKGNRSAALQLEQLCNEILHEIPCRVYCGYPRRLLRTDADDSSVCALHTHVLRSR